MGKIRQINIKNRTYYFYNDQIDYATIKKIGNYNKINRVNPLYLIINEMIGHFEGKNKNKYLVLDEIDESKEVLNKYEEVWQGIKK